MSAPNVKDEKFSKPGFPDRTGEGSKAFCESSPEISTTETESDISFSRSVLPINVNLNVYTKGHKLLMSHFMPRLSFLMLLSVSLI